MAIFKKKNCMGSRAECFQPVGLTGRLPARRSYSSESIQLGERRGNDGLNNKSLAG